MSQKRKATIGDIGKFAEEHGLKPITLWKKEIDIDKILIDPDGTKTLEDLAKESNGFPTKEQIELAAKVMARESGNDLTDCAFIAVPYLLSKGKIKLPRKIKESNNSGIKLSTLTKVRCSFCRKLKNVNQFEHSELKHPFHNENICQACKSKSQFAFLDNEEE